MKRFLRTTINSIQQKNTQIVIIALVILLTMLSSFYLMYAVISNI
ncbi:MAG TPA: hypothetical protein VIO43_03980 [Lutibacter sp.]